MGLTLWSGVGVILPILPFFIPSLRKLLMSFVCFCLFLCLLAINGLCPQLFPKTTAPTLIKDWPLVLTPCRPLLPSWLCVLKPSVLIPGSPPGDFYNIYFSQGLVTITWCWVHEEHHPAQNPFMTFCVSQHLEDLYLSLGFLGRAEIKELFLISFRFWELLKQPEGDKRAFRCCTVPGNFCSFPTQPVCWQSWNVC